MNFLTTVKTPTFLAKSALLLVASTTVVQALAMLPTPTDPKNEPVSGQASASATTTSPITASTAGRTTLPTTAATATAVAPAVVGTPSTATKATNPVTTHITRTANTGTPATAPQMPANTRTVSGNIGGINLSANTASVGTMSLGSTSEGVQSSVYAYLVQGDTLSPVTPTSVVKAGDVIEYHGHFTNTSPDRIRSMTAMLTIADGTELVGGLVPNFAFASIDGSRFARMPLRANMDGEVKELPLSYYKALRWDIEDVGIGGTAVVKYRATVK